MENNPAYRNDTELARSMGQKIEKYLAGGSLGIYRVQLDPLPVFSHAKGSRIVDASGKTYIDFIMGSGPLILGHCHPAIISAVENQLHKGSTYYWVGKPTIDLAEKIVEAAPCGETVKFTNSGTEATLHALRMARVHTGREKILKFEGGYHGVHDYSLMSCYTKKAGSYPEPRPDSGGIPKGVADTVLIAPFNDIETTTEIIKTHHESIAAVIVEPLQRAIKPVGTFLQGLRFLTEKYHIVLIFDEIVTGFRLDYGGAQEHYGVVPDVAVYGKALTGGFSLAAICGKREILDATNPDRAGTPSHAYFSGTLNGNPLAAAAGVACLTELEKVGILKDLHDRGEKFMEAIRDIGNSCGAPLQVAGDGPVMQLFFTGNPIRSYRDTLGQDKDMMKKVTRMLWENGIAATPAKIYLSLAHSSNDLDQFLDTLKGILSKI